MKNVVIYFVLFLAVANYQSNAQVVKFEPFTKSTIVLDGLAYKETIFSIDERDLLTQNLGLDQKIELKLKDLSGLTVTDGMVYFGLRLELYKSGVDTALFTTEDLYNGSGEMMVSDEDGMESSISPSYELTFSKPYFNPKDTVMIIATFYDKKSISSMMVTSIFYLSDKKIEGNFTNSSKGTALESYATKVFETNDFSNSENFKTVLSEDNQIVNLTAAAQDLSQSKKHTLTISGYTCETTNSYWSIRDKNGSEFLTLPATVKTIDNQLIADIDWVKSLIPKDDQYFAILTLSNEKNFDSYIGILKFRVKR
jgi:hypothetical protein